jgi:histidinol-phosphate aminotransferase
MNASSLEKSSTILGSITLADYIFQAPVYTPGKPIEELFREKHLTRISKLASNENPYGPSPLCFSKLQQDFSNFHLYPDMQNHELKAKLSDHYKRPLTHIMIGNGSEGIMGDILKTFIRPGEEILTAEKTFIGFILQAKGFGAICHEVPLNERQEFDLESMAKKITEKTKMIYLAHPNNPTGTYRHKEDMISFLKKVPAHCLVICDEAYIEYAEDYPGYAHSFDFQFQNVITLRTFSKAYGLANLRVGYAFAHPDICQQVTKVRLIFCPNGFAQKAALYCLEDQDHLKMVLKKTKEQKKQCELFFEKEKIPYIPSSTNFITFHFPKAEEARRVHDACLSQGVILRPLDQNLMASSLRISIGTEKEMNHFQESYLNCKK